MDIPFHTHTGIESPRINPQDLLGYSIISGVPVKPAEENAIQYAIVGGVLGLYLYRKGSWTLVASQKFTNIGSLDFPSLPPHTSADLTLSLTGAVIGDTISIGVPDVVISSGTNCANITFFAWVSIDNTVTIRCTNNDDSLTANPAVGSFKVTTT